MIWATLVMALREIRRNLLRSSLTTLGVIIGVGAVIAMVTLGQGATKQVTADISGLGQNLLIIVPGGAHRAATSSTAPMLRLDDVRAVGSEVTGVSTAAPTSGRAVLAVFGNKNARTVVTGTDSAYFEVRAWGMALGRPFSGAELLAGTPACVLGQTVRDKLFGVGDPVGASVRIGNVSCQIVGVLVAKGRSTFGDDQDDLVLMPIRAFQRRIAGNDEVGAIWVSARAGWSTTEVQRDLEALMRQRRQIGPGEEDDFVVRDMKEVQQLVGRATGVLTALLGAIAAVSLLVGGIGIMNIMLVSVTERTREIGIRLAIGAREREVMLQFLVEAVVLSTIGGIVGIAVGLGGSYGACKGLDLPFVIVPEIVVVAFVFSGLVGVAFGFFPARKAARLNPIDALRHE